MPDIKFACAACRQKLEAPEDMAGETLPCPACNKPISIPKPDPVAPAAPPKPRPTLTIGTMNNLVESATRAADKAAEKAAPAPVAGPGAGKCKSCGESMEAGTVLCLKCGFHAKLGKKLNTDLA